MGARSIAVVAAMLMGAVAFGASREEAQARAQAWMSLVDNQKYAESWAESSSTFRSRVPQQRWIDEAKRVREPLGSVNSRRLLTVRFAKTLPGAPDGDYAVLQFRSSFTHKAAAIETITLVMDDGQLRAVGYFIK
jgi:Protein of unknown function (DUF4019)